MANILDAGGKLILPLAKSDTLYIRRDKIVQSEGVVDVSFSVPRLHQAFVARALNGTLAMHKVTSERDGKIILSCSGGRQLVALYLKKNERLSVVVAFIVGFSRGPRFESFANLSVAAFACDRNFSTVVHGPGLVLLETSGNHAIHTNGNVMLDPGQLIAWDPETPFTLDKVNGLADLYFNRIRVTCNIGPRHLPIVADSVPRHDGAASPLWSFLKSVYIPRLY